MLEQAEAMARMSQTYMANGDVENARRSAATGLTLVPSHPACSQVLSQLPPAMSAPVPAPMPARVQYKLFKHHVYLKKEVGPQSNIVRKLEPQSVVDVSDICIYQNTTRLLCHCDNGDEGWADYRRDGKNRNMTQTKPEGPPEGPGDESARSVAADSLISGQLEKKGMIRWKDRWFAIAPREVTPKNPSRYLYYFEDRDAVRPKDRVPIHKCRATPSHDQAHSLTVHCPRGGKEDYQGDHPDQYLVRVNPPPLARPDAAAEWCVCAQLAAQTAETIARWLAAFEQAVTGEREVPERLSVVAPPPVEPEPQPEPEPVVWEINRNYRPPAGGDQFDRQGRPPPSGFEYDFGAETAIIERLDRQEAERQAAIRAEEEAREAARQAQAERERIAAEEEAARIAAEEERLRIAAEEEAARIAAEEEAERERIAAEVEAKSAGRWLASVGGAELRELYEQGLIDQVRATDTSHSRSLVQTS